jgi:hypothetical protein
MSEDVPEIPSEDAVAEASQALASARLECGVPESRVCGNFTMNLPKTPVLRESCQSAAGREEGINQSGQRLIPFCSSFSIKGHSE